LDVTPGLCENNGESTTGCLCCRRCQQERKVKTSGTLVSHSVDTSRHLEGKSHRTTYLRTVLVPRIRSKKVTAKSSGRYLKALPWKPVPVDDRSYLLQALPPDDVFFIVHRKVFTYCTGVTNEEAAENRRQLTLVFYCSLPKATTNHTGRRLVSALQQNRY
jgi:hypothetical protein